MREDIAGRMKFVKHSTLELAWKRREEGGGRTGRDYLDFVVDGASLHDTLRLGDSIGCLGWGSGEGERHHIAQLLLREQSELQSGRVAIYICPECGDLGCGAVTVRISRDGEGFVWSDFAFETTLEGIVEQYEDVGSLAFNKTEYWHLLNGRAAAIPV